MNFVTDKQQKYLPVLTELNLLVAIDRQLRCEAKYSCVKDKKFLNLISSLIYGKFCPRRKVTVYEDRWLCHEFEILCENTEINIGGSTYGGLHGGSRNQVCGKQYKMKASKGKVLVYLDAMTGHYDQRPKGLNSVEEFQKTNICVLTMFENKLSPHQARSPASKGIKQQSVFPAVSFNFLNLNNKLFNKERF